MKKYITTKNIRRFVMAVSALLVMAMLLAVSINAIMDTDDVLDIGLGATAARTEMDNLFLYMMNECLPEGSIYMTTDYADIQDMVDQFGGKWERWGQGRVPVGENVDNLDGVIKIGDPDGTMAIPGRSATITDVELEVDGTIALSEVEVIKRTNNGSVTLGNNGSIILGGAPTLTSDGIRLEEKHIPPHKHNYTWTIQYRIQTSGNDPSTQATLDPGTVGGFNYATWSITIYSAGYTNPAMFYVNTKFDLAAHFSATYSTPAHHYTPPEVVYVNQKVNSIDLSATGTGLLEWDDQTVQPYATVYMYRRTELAELDPLT